MATHAGPAAAAETEPAACATQATTVEMVECADWHFAEADRWLAQVMQSARGNTDREARRLRHAAQRNWIRYREAKCRAERDAARGGTMAPILEISCRTELTRARARALSAANPALAPAVDAPFYEVPHTAVLGAFTCGDRLMEARIGLVPAPAGHDAPVRARLLIGPHVLDWAIGGANQGAFCGADLSLSVIANERAPACPIVRVDDGLCDAFFVEWNRETRAFEWTRN